MRYVAAYLLAALGGNESPSAENIEKILSSVGIEADGEKLKKVIAELKGKDLQTLIAEGNVIFLILRWWWSYDEQLNHHLSTETLWWKLFRPDICMLKRNYSVDGSRFISFFSIVAGQTKLASMPAGGAAPAAAAPAAGGAAAAAPAKGKRK